MSFLDKTGLEHFWAQCLNKFAHKETVTNLSTLVGTTAVATQISDAIDDITFPVVSVNNKTGAVSLNASDVGAVPTTRTINNKALSSNITLAASDVGAVPTTRTINGKALSSNITLSASDVSALPSTTSIPDALADLTSDATHRTVTDAEKATWNAKSDFSGSYNDLTNKPTIPSISGLATETYVDNKVASILDSAPETLNTLNELAAALGDDPNFATTIATEIGGKVSKSGDEMTGALITPSTYAKGIFPSYGYMNADGTPVVLMQVDANNNRLGIHQKRGGTSVWESNEAYMLPAPNLDQTATVAYDILTSKNPVTIAQGGTGATTKRDACWSLMYGVTIQPTGIEFLPGSTTAYHGGHIDFHYNNDSSADYTSRIIEDANGVININGVTASNGILTATKVIGAVYA